MKLLSNKQIWNKGAHSAFTDLCEYRGQYFCCFRQAQAHISREGIIQILVSDDLEHWQLASTVRKTHFDLRDPKLSIDNRGKLALLYAQVQREVTEPPTPFHTMYRTSNDGISWSTPRSIAKDGGWLWRISWFNQQAYGISYDGKNKVMLYQGLPYSTFDCIDQEFFTKKRYGKGYPNESDILFLPDNSAVCVLRRDADTCTAQLGRSKFPFKQWQWHDLQQYVGGPALIRYQDKIILAGRSFNKEQGCKTALWRVNLSTNKLEHLLTLPSKGDTSYPGLVIKDQLLYVSYYSEHLDNKACIYLAKVAL